MNAASFPGSAVPSSQTSAACLLKPLVSVVIVNWNTRQLLQDCLASLATVKLRERMEVIVVDNASNDGSVEMVRRSHPDVRLIVNTDNQGYGRANNRGIEAGKADLLLLLKSDTIVPEDSVAAMVEAVMREPRIGVLGCRLLNADGSFQLSCMKFPGLGHVCVEQLLLHRLLPGLRTSYVEPPYLGGRTKCDWVIGAAMLVRRQAITDVGGFDPAIWMYGEEMELCYRIRAKGWEIAFDPEPRIIHLGEGSWSKASCSTRYLRCRGLISFYDKHFGPVRCTVVRGAVLCGALLRLSIWIALLAAKAREAQRCRAEIGSQLRVIRELASGLKRIAAAQGAAQ